jgi:DnaJ-class molecular chaperone
MAWGTSEQQADRCATCRGRGWLHVRTRPVYRPGVLNLPASPLPRETCWDCGGKGRAATTSQGPGLMEAAS